MSFSTPRWWRLKEVRLLPGEQPESANILKQRLEGQVLSRFHFFPDPMPDGGAAAGLELVSTERWIVWASPGQRVVTLGTPVYRQRLLWRMIPAQRIQTPRVLRYFGYGRDSRLFTAVSTSPGADLAESPADPVQQRLEGQVIRGVHPILAPNAEGGEQTELEFGDGTRLHLAALRGQGRYTADLGWEVKEPPTRSIFTPWS